MENFLGNNLSTPQRKGYGLHTSYLPRPFVELHWICCWTTSSEYIKIFSRTTFMLQISVHKAATKSQTSLLSIYSFQTFLFIKFPQTQYEDISETIKQQSFANPQLRSKMMQYTSDLVGYPARDNRWVFKDLAIRSNKYPKFCNQNETKERIMPITESITSQETSSG